MFRNTLFSALNSIYRRFIMVSHDIINIEEEEKAVSKPRFQRILRKLDQIQNSNKE